MSSGIYIRTGNCSRSGTTCGQARWKTTRDGVSITSLPRVRLRRKLARLMSTSDRDAHHEPPITRFSGRSSRNSPQRGTKGSRKSFCEFCAFCRYFFLPALLACRESAVRDAALRPSRFSARLVAAERLGDAFRPDFPRARSRWACLRVREDALPFRGGLSFTPERRAFDRPIAMACFVDRAPCFPSRTCSISSRTNSPAWVVGALPSRFALRARSSVFFSGINILPRKHNCN